MNKWETNMSIIGEAAKALKPHVSKEDFQKIQKEHDMVEDHSPSLRAMDYFDGPEMFSYEQVVRIVAEDNNLTHLTDPIFAKLET